MFKVLLFELFLLFSLLSNEQDFNVEEFFDGQWCDKNQVDCFNIIAMDGLLIYETLTGDFRTGIEIIEYEEKSKTISWELVRTNRQINLFKILNQDKVEYDNNFRRAILYRQKKK